MTRVALEGMEFYAYHGYYEEEREKGNEFIVDVHCDISTFDSLDDNISDTLNYEDIFNICADYMSKKYKLLETVALHIATDIKKKYPKTLKIKVKIAKLNPPIPGNIQKAVVEYILK